MMKHREDERHEEDHIIISNILPSPLVSRPIIKRQQGDSEYYQTQVSRTSKRTGHVDVHSLPTEHISDDYLKELEPLTEDWASNSDFLGRKKGGIVQHMNGDGIPEYAYESLAVGFKQQDEMIREEVAELNNELRAIIVVAGTNDLDVGQRKDAVEIFDQINSSLDYSDKLVEIGADRELVQQHLEIVHQHLRICAKDIQIRGHELVQDLEGVKDPVFAEEPDRIVAQEFVDSYLIATEWFEHMAQEMVKDERADVQAAGMRLAGELNDTEQAMISLEENDAPSRRIIRRARRDIEHMVDICYTVYSKRDERDSSAIVETA